MSHIKILLSTLTFSFLAYRNHCSQLIALKDSERNNIWKLQATYLKIY